MGDFWQDIQNAAKAAIPFVGGGLSFLGGILGNSANAEQAARNRRFVAQMYKKRYQFTVEDMRKAGLNPILAANGGSVGSVPSVSTPTMTNALEAGVSGALSTARAVSDIQAQSVSNAKTEADQKLAEANTQLAQGKKIEQDIRNEELPKAVRAQAFRAEAEASLANSAAVIQRSRAANADELAEHERYNKYAKNIQLYQDIKSKPDHSQRRVLWYLKELAKIRKLNAEVGYGGWNTAAKVAGTFARFLK